MIKTYCCLIKILERAREKAAQENKYEVRGKEKSLQTNEHEYCMILKLRTKSQNQMMTVMVERVW